VREDLICPRPSDESLLLPSDRWEGRCVPKPWEFACSVQIPHLETPETLPLLVELLRLQTVRPFIMLIDTGSSRETCERLESLRAPDVEIHYLRGHGFRHASEVICAAMDLGQSLCRTEHLFLTHADVFLRRRDLLEVLTKRCTGGNPVVGYRMSERSWITDEWRDCVGHTATMLHIPTIHRAGVTWSYGRIVADYGYRPGACGGWPDTETGFNAGLRLAGIKPDFCGQDENYKRYVDENIDHVRSYPGSKLYCAGYHRTACQWMMDALTEAAARVEKWRAEVAHARRAVQAR
jgi:hypothetical protein